MQIFSLGVSNVKPCFLGKMRKISLLSFAELAQGVIKVNLKGFIQLKL